MPKTHFVSRKCLMSQMGLTGLPWNISASPGLAGQAKKAEGADAAHDDAAPLQPEKHINNLMHTTNTTESQQQQGAVEGRRLRVLPVRSPGRAMIIGESQPSEDEPTMPKSKARVVNSFSDRVADLAAYKKKYGHLNVRKKENKSLSNFIHHARQARKGKRTMTLTDERIASLDALGFEWGVDKEKQFSDRVTELAAFKKKHGHLNVSEKENKSLSNFIHHVRQARKGKGKTMKMTDGRIASLDALGFDWRLAGEASKQNPAALKKGDSIQSPGPTKQIEKGINLQRGDKVRVLSNVIDCFGDKQKEWFYGEVRASNTSSVRIRYDDATEKEMAYPSNDLQKLDPTSVERDNWQVTVGSAVDCFFQDGAYKNARKGWFRAYVASINEDGSRCDVLYPDGCYEAEVPLNKVRFVKQVDPDGGWMVGKQVLLELEEASSKCATSFRAGTVLTVQAQLQHCQVVFDDKASTHVTLDDAAVGVFRFLSKDCPHKKRYVWPAANSSLSMADSVKLRRRTTNIQWAMESYASPKLPQKQSGAPPKNESQPSEGKTMRRKSKARAPKSFSERVADLAAYKKKHGHLNVSSKKDISLYRFCDSARQARKGNGKTMKMTDDRIALLDTLGFDWIGKQKSFAERVADLAAYKKKHGHLNVSKTENNSLYKFCINTRQARKGNGGRKKLADERIASLDELGFEW